MPAIDNPPPYNPFSPPPVTATPPPGEHGFEGPGPTRVLWPVFLVALLCWTAVKLWNTWFLRQQIPDIARAHFFVAATLSGLVVGVLLASLIGDRRAAKAAVMASLALLAAGVVTSMLGLEGLALQAVGLGGRLGTTFIGLITLAYCLRATSVRGVYIAMIFLNGAMVLSTAGNTLGHTLLRGGQLSLFAAATLAVGALICAVFLVHPQRCTHSDAAPPLPLPRVLLIVVLLGTFRTLQAQMSLFRRISAVSTFQPRGLPSLLDNLPQSLWWLLPLPAYFGRWRPLPLVLAGIWLTAAGGFGMALFDGGPQLVASRFAAGIGYYALFDVASAVLLRQVLPMERAARWLALQSVVTHGLQLGFFTLVRISDGALYGARSPLLAILIAMAGLGLALLLTTRRAALRPLT